MICTYICCLLTAEGIVQPLQTDAHLKDKAWLGRGIVLKEAIPSPASPSKSNNVGEIDIPFYMNSDSKLICTTSRKRPDSIS